MGRKVSLSVSLELDQVQWLDEQDDNRSDAIRALIESERGDE